MTMTNTQTEPGASERSSLPKHLMAVVEPSAPAKVHRPQVAKQRFSRTARQARKQDGVDTSVRVRMMPLNVGVDDRLPEGSWEPIALSDCANGCKIYGERETGREAVVHNSVYGCRVGR